MFSWNLFAWFKKKWTELENRSMSFDSVNSSNILRLKTVYKHIYVQTVKESEEPPWATAIWDLATIGLTNDPPHIGSSFSKSKILIKSSTKRHKKKLLPRMHKEQIYSCIFLCRKDRFTTFRYSVERWWG